jgi:hypothetical protein
MRLVFYRRLIAFSIWERRSGSGRNVTFPARQYSINGERRSFALLRPIADTTAQDRIRELVSMCTPSSRSAPSHRVDGQPGRPSRALRFCLGYYSSISTSVPIAI